jgi:methyl-accepting chemotaxis protein
MNLANLKIGVRLALGFALVLTLSVVIGIFSVNKLATVNDATAEIATKWLVGTRTLGVYETAINEIRRGEAQHLMANKEELFVRAEKIISDGREKAAKALKDYGDTVTPGEEQKLYAAIQAAQERYFATQPDLLKLSRASDGVSDALRDAYNGAS